MQTLRITQSGASPGKHRVDLSLESPKAARRTAVAEFAFTLSPQQSEDLRWYYEESLLAADPGPALASQIETRMAELGRDLFRNIFQANDDCREVWYGVHDHLDDARIEVLSGIAESATMPWELLRDPKSDVVLALVARTFVRAHSNPSKQPHLPTPHDVPVRILLAICRPGGAEDVPFRSVAIRLLTSLGQAANKNYRLDLLRPPTFASLGRVLRDAKAAGRPYHVVHFDGHGDFLDPEDIARLKLEVIGTGEPPAGGRGYLVFEKEEVAGNPSAVSGAAMGTVLAETDVHVLVLNACRSAHADPPEHPLAEGASIHAGIRAYGSLALEVMDAGIAGVVAMRYSVYVVTAAQFVADLYANLVAGRSLGESVSRGRKHLKDKPLRAVGFAPRALQDWSVPVVYEAAELRLFPTIPDVDLDAITLKLDDGPLEGSPLPPRPNAGFIGRDEALLALDRLFDHQRIVLLQAFAGSGKTATVVEFARWYLATGGLKGLALFSSFEQHVPLARLLNQLAELAQPILERSEIHWLALSAVARRKVALSLLRTVPVLWLWDNIEPVNGFPAGAESPWSGAEQVELRTFLRDAAGAGARFLLTSRRDERAWLGDLPARLSLPPMPMTDRIALARAIAEKAGRQIAAEEDWRPLLRFTQGNPLTLSVLVRQVLREGWRTRAQITEFVTALEAGKTDLQDDEREGRSASLGASLRYGLNHRLDPHEQRRLALLHLFTGWVRADVFRYMGQEAESWVLDEMRGATEGEVEALLDHAVDAGLLERSTGDYYSIHPALPWFFQRLFDTHFGADRHRAEQAFAGAVATNGIIMTQFYDRGVDVGVLLDREEDNLLRSTRLALAHRWPRIATGSMQALRRLYALRSRVAEYARLVDEALPILTTPAGGPQPGCEDQWTIITDDRVWLAEQSRRLDEAERLQRACVEWDAQRASEALTRPAAAWTQPERHAVTTLAVSKERLAHILFNREDAESVTWARAALADFTALAMTAARVRVLGLLGNIYMTTLDPPDLKAAENAYREEYELADTEVSEGTALLSLGRVRFTQFNRGVQDHKDRDDIDFQKALKELVGYLAEAEDFGAKGLAKMTGAHGGERLRANYFMGEVMGAHASVVRAADMEWKNIVKRGLAYLHHALQIAEPIGDRRMAAYCRIEAARLLAFDDRWNEATLYAQAAIADCAAIGPELDGIRDSAQQIIEDAAGKIT